MSNMINKPILICDSGAFSVWSKGAELNIKDYADFIMRYEKHMEYIVNLDVIPGQVNQIAAITPEIKEESARKGYENYKYLLSRGIPKEKLIHVFHQGEDTKWLTKMCAEIPYIGLSPANDRTTDEKMKWLDGIMPYCTDKDGFPLNKWHGFAVTSIRLMHRIPFFSCDSSSWAVQAGMGGVYMPKKKNGEYSYAHGDTYVLSVSAKSPAAKVAGKSYATMTPMEQIEVLEYFKHCGVTIGRSEIEGPVPVGYKLKRGERWLGEDDLYSGLVTQSAYVNTDEHVYVERIIESGVSNDWRPRVALNVKFFKELNKTFPAWPWAYKRQKQGFGFRR